MRCPHWSLALFCLASKALAALEWPTDSQLRATFLQKRGLGFYYTAQNGSPAMLKFLKASADLAAA